jgi:Ca-activated chloride channel homolog
MTFAEPLWFGALLVLPLLFLLKQKGYLGFSKHSLLNDVDSRLTRAVSMAPTFFLMSTVVLMVVALARPQIPGEPVQKTTPGRDIVLAVDISFSMSFPFKGELAPRRIPEELAFQVPFEERRRNNKGLQLNQPDAKDGLQRIHAAQSALLNFIENRWRGKTGDRIGLIVFDTKPRYAWPITDDLRQLYRKAQFMQTNLGTGTNFGARGAGPFDLAVEHFKDAGQAKSKVLILVTDGEDDIDGETVYRLAALLQENNIRFYMVGIGETLAQKRVGIVKFTERVGGRMFRVEDTQSLQECFETIDRLEKSEVTISQLETRDDVFFIFAWAALVSLGLFLVFEVFVHTR